MNFENEVPFIMDLLWAWLLAYLISRRQYSVTQDSSTDILDRTIFIVGAVLCIQGCLAESLASTH